MFYLLEASECFYLNGTEGRALCFLRHLNGAGKYSHSGCYLFPSGGAFRKPGMLLDHCQGGRVVSKYLVQSWRDLDPSTKVIYCSPTVSALPSQVPPTEERAGKDVFSQIGVYLSLCLQASPRLCNNWQVFIPERKHAYLLSPPVWKGLH